MPAAEHARPPSAPCRPYWLTLQLERRPRWVRNVYWHLFDLGYGHGPIEQILSHAKLDGTVECVPGDLLHPDHRRGVERLLPVAKDWFGNWDVLRYTTATEAAR